MTSRLKCAALAAICGCAALAAASDAAAQTNLLANPEFVANLSSWTILYSRPAVWSSRDAGGATSGSARITNEGVSNGGVPLTLSQCQPVSPDTQYRFGALQLIPAGQPANTAAEIFVYPYGSGDCSGTAGEAAYAAAATVESWGPMTGTLVTGSGVHSVAMLMGVYKPNGVATDAAANFDNMFLYAVSGSAVHAIDATLSGSWYNTATPGQGLFLDVSPSIGLFFAGWYTWTGTPGQYDWVTAQGGYGGGTATVPMYRTRGGVFNSAAAVTTAPAGWAEFRFADCRHAQATFLFTGGGPSGTFALQRLTPPLPGCTD